MTARRIRPMDIIVPEDDVFKNDLLSRRREIEVLSAMFTSLQKGPCVLAVDAPWGYGKTTFIELCNHQLKKEKYHVIKFNAWENDFTDNPLISLFAVFNRKIKSTIYDNRNKTSLNIKDVENYERIKNNLTNLSVYSERIITTRTIFTSISIGGMNMGIKSQTLKQLKNISSDYNTYIKLKDQFNETLKSFSSNLYENNLVKRPLIIIIDELDRCRPNYAIQFLEVIKHFFSVEHVIFILAINSSQLAHSIKAVYGQDFDAKGYLRRFFDINFKLPNKNRKTFIRNILDNQNITEYFNNHQNKEVEDTGIKFANVLDVLYSFLGSSDLSLRQTSCSIHYLGLVFASLDENQKPHILTTIVALIFRTFESELYHSFCQGQISDARAIEAIAAHPGIRVLQNKEEWYIFVAILILSYYEINNVDPDQCATKIDVEPVKNVVKRLLDQGKQHRLTIKELIGFRLSVNHIEMFVDINYP